MRHSSAQVSCSTSGRCVAPSLPTAIAVVSDLHVGDLARSADLSRRQASDGKPAGYLDEFAAYVTSQKLRADLLLIAGDLTDRAHPQEFQVAAKAVDAVAAAFSLRTDRDVFLVPGNHDVSWKALSQDPDDETGYSLQSRYYPLRYSDWPFDQLMQSGTQHLCEPPYSVIRQVPGALVVTFNSCSHDGPLESPDAPHFGLAPQETIAALDRALTLLAPDASVLRVFLLHHHVVARDDRARDYHDPSLTVNSVELLELLGKHRFDLVVHGHKHAGRHGATKFDPGSRRLLVYVPSLVRRCSQLAGHDKPAPSRDRRFRV
jgi:UDP-2,3-diacylglucosamine pyrophosphatase LpxH